MSLIQGNDLLMDQNKEAIKSMFKYDPVRTSVRGKGGENGCEHSF